jgi:hypothetical protein
VLSVIEPSLKVLNESYSSERAFREDGSLDLVHFFGDVAGDDEGRPISYEDVVFNANADVVVLGVDVRAFGDVKARFDGNVVPRSQFLVRGEALRVMDVHSQVVANRVWVEAMVVVVMAVQDAQRTHVLCQ